jgi:flagellar biosynthetic protein FliR
VDNVFDLVTFGAERIQLLLLLLMRVGGLMMTAPVFSHNSVPRRVALAMTLGFGVILLPLFNDTPLPQTGSLIMLVFFCLTEFLVGVVISLVFSVIFQSIRFAGAIVGYQIGFSMVNVVDPSSSEQVSVIGEFWFLLATLIFICLNGHHLIITGLVDSYRAIPLGAGSPSGAVGEWLIKYSALVFVLGVKFAAPAILTVFLVDVAMGVLARTMPQMNIFIVGFPVKIYAGLAVVGLSLPAFSYLLTKITAGLDRELAHLMKLYHLAGTV